MRRGRIHGEKNMRNSRTKTQTKLRNYIKLTAGALLLAITFVLVFAGTLSGAFGIENELQQNGTIENNVASAAVTGTSDANTSGYEVQIENNIKDGGSFLLTTSDFLNSSPFSVPEKASGSRGWGWYSDASTGDQKHFMIAIPLSGKIKSALSNGIKIGVSMTAIQRGSGSNDWGTMGIYSSMPTSLKVHNPGSGNNYGWQVLLLQPHFRD